MQAGGQVLFKRGGLGKITSTLMIMKIMIMIMMIMMIMMNMTILMIIMMMITECKLGDELSTK